MTVARRWELQSAIYFRLTDALISAGINRAPVAVYDHVPVDPLRLHVRIDGFLAIPGPTTDCIRARHEFMVHVFDDNSGIVTGIGAFDIARLQSIVVAALENWSPFAGATAIIHLSSNSASDQNPLTQHAVSKFSTHI